MLIAKLDQVAQEIANLRELKQLAANAQSFATRAQKLGEPSLQLESLAIIAQEMKRRGISVAFDNGQEARLSAFAKQLRVIAEAYHADPQSIIATGDQRYTFWEPLKTLPDQAHDALLRAWSQHVADTLPAQQPELLQTLGRVPGFEPSVATIKRLYTEAESLQSRLPQSADMIDRITFIAAELKSAWAQLPTEGVPTEVREFLTAAVDGNARLAQLTGPVLEWLQVNNLVDGVRISLKA